ncbi:MAG: riboflavin synthase [Rhodospirillaceae bacterium]|jgi:riboflavin synthase|nr:riboflavin synthase [Rhodospirillaceae bacterium]MBT6609078.1 riboflavin synthase [Rhodospirillaceae bacterium]MBT7508857.1 riboflavin synthase [Rhodospirillaceae bacterium]
MFTGIVTDIGNVRAIAADGDTRLEITTTFDTSAIAIGASICCSGACLTVIDKGSEWFAAMVSAETLSKTTLSDWQVGTPVNLERALRMGDELGGHIVSGHVDGVGTLDASETEGASTRMIFEAPSDLIRFIAPKGSITIDGVSLTVNDVTDNTFGINVIPHTQEATTLGALSVGGTVNLEIDMLARYVARLQDTST